MPNDNEGRIAKLVLNAPAPPKLDAEFEEITAGEELTKSESFRTKWAAFRATVKLRLADSSKEASTNLARIPPRGEVGVIACARATRAGFGG